MLIFVNHKFIADRYVFQFGSNRMKITSDGSVFGYCFIWNNFFRIDLVDLVFSNMCVVNLNKVIGSVTLHDRPAHIRQDRMKRLDREDLLVALAKVYLPICES